MAKGRGSASHGLLIRVASAVALGAPVVAVVLAGGVWFLLILLAFACAGILEALAMLRAAGYRPLRAVSVPVTLALAVHPQVGAGLLGPAALAVGVMASLVWLMFRREHSLADWALSLAVPLYVGGLLQYFGWLRALPDGAYWVLCLLALSWTCDTAAYGVGGRFGRARLAPAVSPSKSVEGALAGLAASVVLGAVIAVAGPATPFFMAGFGLVVGLATIAGDLGESLLKRLSGVKDASRAIPGHGGFLDRMDALLFGAPLVYFYLLLTGHAP